MSIAPKLTKTEVQSVYSAANSAIWHSHALAATSAMKTVREEDFVATLVTDGVPILADRWAELLLPKGIDLKIAGVFCHGQPQVTFGTPRNRVELADLLVVHQHTSQKQTTSRAMLIQAKMSSDSTHTLPANDPQLLLFSTWPTFEFVSGGMQPGPRDINEYGKGSRYALVHSDHAFPEDIRWVDQCPWAASPATRILSGERSLARVLGDMLLGKDGRIARLHKPNNDWSHLIKELLETTGKRTYRRKNIRRGETPRLSPGERSGLNMLFCSGSSNLPSATPSQMRRSASTLFFSHLHDVNDNGDDGDLPIAKRQSNDGGISTLLLETRAVGQW